MANRYAGGFNVKQTIWKSVESAGLWSLGDVVAQGLAIHRKGRQASAAGGSETAALRPPQFVGMLDWGRTGRAAFFAAFIFAPLGARWYKSLDRVFPNKDGKTPVMQRVLSDQLIWAPVIVTLFFAYHSLLEGGFPQNFLTKLRHEMWPTMLMNWVMWAPAQAANFYLVPPRHWMLVVNCVAIPWTAFASHVNARAAETQVALSEAQAVRQAAEEELRLRLVEAGKEDKRTKLLR